MQQTLLDIFYGAYRANRCLLSVLVDPDKPSEGELIKTAQIAQEGGADMFFVGGSLLMHHRLDQTLDQLKAASNLPAILFPGSLLQLSAKADGMLFLSLISGRNPDLLIGHHVMAAPIIKEMQLATLPTGYILVDSGRQTTATYMSGAQPIPYNKPEIAAATALAGEMLGLKLMYLDAGSGADQAISPEMVAAVRKVSQCPIIVGGGIRNAETAAELAEAGANVVVIGNVVEHNPLIIPEIAKAIKK